MKLKFNFFFKYFIAGLIILPAINYNSFITKQDNITISNGASENSYIIWTWNIQNSIEIVWEASLVDEQSLQFNKAWTVTKVNFKAWDDVRKWETIAELDNSDAYVSIEEARLSLDNAKINLSQLYEPPDESNLLQARNSIINAEKSLEIVKKEFENLKISQDNSLTKIKEWIETSKKELEAIKTSLEITKSEFEVFKKEKEDSLENTEISKNSTITDIEDDFKSYLADIEKIIEEADYIMWVSKDNRDKNDSYEAFLWAKNISIKNNAQNSLREVINMYNSLKTDLEAYDYSWDKKKLETLLNSCLDIFNKLYETSDYIYKTAKNSVTSVNSFSDSDISSIKNSMSLYKSTSLSKISTIKSSLDSLKTLIDIDLVVASNDNTIASRKESIKSQELAMERKELDIVNSAKSYLETVESYKLAFKSKQNDLNSKEKSLEISKLNLEELLRWPTDENVRKARNSIKQAEIKLENAYKNLADYVLKAPFDWIIRMIDYMPWDNLTNDTSKYVYIENPNLLEITVMLDQIDIVKVRQWDKAIITFDAYKNTPVAWKINLIDITPTKTSGVVYYQVKLILDDPEFDKKVLSWMTANIEIITESKDDIILVKTSVIQNNNWKKIVIVEKNWKWENVEIETWISSGWMTEVISWLNIWDKVFEKEFIITTEKETPNTWLFSVPSRRWWRNFNR